MPNRLTRRQSQRPSLSRLVLSYDSPKEEDGQLDLLSHEPRQRRSWLVFDVRQNMKHSMTEAQIRGLEQSLLLVCAGSDPGRVPFAMVSRESARLPKVE